MARKGSPSFYADRERERRRNRPAAHTLWVSARSRARRNNISFDLDPEDVVVPRRCPVFGIKLKKSINGTLSPSSPTLDRIRPLLGYVKGNVVVVSWRANHLKNNGEIGELIKLAKYYKRYL